MAISETKKSFMRADVSRAVRQMRDRLGITLDRLAEMVGSQVSMVTVWRWEHGALMPYPKNRRRLADIALGRGWWDIAAALNVEMPFDEWLSVFEANLPEEYRDWMVLTMCALYCSAFQPDDPSMPTDEEFGIVQKAQELRKTASDLLEHLLRLHENGKQIIAPPPLAHCRRFWYDVLERRTAHGKAKKSAR